jgi:hypothetical protein
MTRIDPVLNEVRARAGHRSAGCARHSELLDEESSGAGPQTVVWPRDKGLWAAVVMNTDSARAVRASVSVAPKVPLRRWLGIGLLGGSEVLAAAGGALIFSGTRRRSRTPSAQTRAA